MPKDILGRPIITAADMDAMTKEERDAAFRAGIVWDLDELPPDYLAKLLDGAVERVARRDGEQREAS